MLKLQYYLLKFLENGVTALLCKVLPGFQRLRRCRHKSVSLLDLKGLGKEIKAAMLVGFHIITASIWKKKLTKQLTERLSFAIGIFVDGIPSINFFCEM